VTDRSAQQNVRLEDPPELMVLFRAESGNIGKIRMVSMEDSLDAGGLPFLWLEGVKAPESVGLLEQFVRAAKEDARRPEDIGKGALAAIAQHNDASVDRALASFVTPSQPAALRKETAFWLGDARGAEGLRLLQKMAQSDPSTEVLEQVAFAFSISPEPGALAELVRMAHDNQFPRVRGQALFWLGQKAGERASKAITGSIESDPDTDVKKKAVFALSQMPPDQGVPKLIQVAQTNRNLTVRKEAMFWLGQSGDPRALAFFEKVLSQ
jgi:HEAT repeat protein